MSAAGHRLWFRAFVAVFTAVALVPLHVDAAGLQADGPPERSENCCGDAGDASTDEAGDESGRERSTQHPVPDRSGDRPCDCGCCASLALSLPMLAASASGVLFLNDASHPLPPTTAARPALVWLGAPFQPPID